MTVSKSEEFSWVAALALSLDLQSESSLEEGAAEESQDSCSRKKDEEEREQRSKS